jgi:FimV-like protein
LKKIITFFLFFLFANVALAQLNLSDQKYHITYLKNIGISQKREHLQDQAKLRLAKLQNKQLTQKTEQLLSENQELQSDNAESQQQSEEQQKTITELQDNINKLTYVNLGLQEQARFTSPHFVSKRFLLNYPWLNNIMQQLDLPLTLVGAALVIILLLLLLIYKSIAYRWSKKKSSKDEPVPATQTSINYNYLAGEDVVTAKLNLAHAYCDMEDYSSAKEILVEIVKEGTEQQREEARNLLVKTLNSI